MQVLHGILVSEGVLTLGHYDLPRNPAGNFRVSGDAFAVVDKHNTSSVSQDEWVGFEAEHKAYGTPPKFD
jgi:hypothetical protein